VLDQPRRGRGNDCCHASTTATDDPFAACTVGPDTGLSYVRSEVEPFGAVNPSNASNMIFTGDYEALPTVGSNFVPVFVQGACGTSLTCRALTNVTPPANRTPTGNDSTDVYVGTGF
jgi:hypothetical protein